VVQQEEDTDGPKQEHVVLLAVGIGKEQKVSGL
jgi:hypothetical protein